MTVIFESTHQQGYGIYDRIDIDMDDFLFLHVCLKKQNNSRRKFLIGKRHSRMKIIIVENLQKKIERIEKELRLYQEIADGC